MTIVEYHVTPTHRYFMRRTKADIISKIEQMSGKKYSIEEYNELLRKEKYHLANEAMRVFRSLPS